MNLEKGTDVEQDPADRAKALAERLFLVQRELDEERQARREATAMLSVMFEVSAEITRDLGEAEAELRREQFTVERLREALVETRSLRDDRERALSGEIEFWRSTAEAWQVALLLH
ncbi:hypothetical protein ACH5AU_30760 [Streptomyces albidoflavus]